MGSNLIPTLITENYTFPIVPLPICEKPLLILDQFNQQRVAHTLI